MSSDMEYVVEKNLLDHKRKNIENLMKTCRYGIAYAAKTNYAYCPYVDEIFETQVPQECPLVEVYDCTHIIYPNNYCDKICDIRHGVKEAKHD